MWGCENLAVWLAQRDSLLLVVFPSFQFHPDHDINEATSTTTTYGDI